MSLTNQYQPLLPDVPVLAILPSNPTEPTHIFQILTQDWQLPFSHLDHPDIHWLNREESLKIEMIRDLQTQLSYKPYSGNISCYILSHLETASQPALQALLKILEEPPKHVHLILTASSSTNVLPTILSRCQVVHVSAASNLDLTQINEWYNQVSLAPLGKLVEWADELGEKEAAQTQAHTLLYFLHQRLATQLGSTEQTRLLKQLQATQTYLEWLQQNLNLKLATSEWLFCLRQA